MVIETTYCPHCNAELFATLDDGDAPVTCASCGAQVPQTALVDGWTIDPPAAGGDLRDVPPFPSVDYASVAADVWSACEALLAPWSGKCRDACALAKVPYEAGWLTATTGLTADELGAPVAQAVNAVLLGRRGI